MALTCANVTGSPNKHVFVGTGNIDKTSNGWCIEVATFRFVAGSEFGTVNLTLNGRSIASFTCPGPSACSGDNVVPLQQIRLARPDAVLSWSTSGCVDSTGTPCTSGQQIMATIEVGYELATPLTP